MAFDKNTPMGKTKAVAMQDDSLGADTSEQPSISDIVSDIVDDQEPESEPAGE
ncbi:hypothetical protein [Mucilaginibacter agri]|uniref:Uncharacterized protein n=1 Tax=Mucilaginibacter agri TaxID=2695265 RepID=A0A965ZE57_9SPHI|nr:hypothetical protein [Mucilaginibacter agri]NCD68116.1 hypothetical protein [Mucilaginibacter agri]